jgi:hypothetical protein
MLMRNLVQIVFGAALLCPALPTVAEARPASAHVRQGAVASGKNAASARRVRRQRVLRPTVNRTQIRRERNILVSRRFDRLEDASAIVRALADGDPRGLWQLGIEPPKNFDTQMNEWAVVRGKNGRYRIMRGAKLSVSPQRSDLEIVEHSHPLDVLLSRPQTIEEILLGAESYHLTPSAYDGDLDVMLEWGQKQHKIHMGVVLLEDGRIGNPVTKAGQRIVNRDGSLPPSITLVVKEPEREVFREKTRGKEGIWLYRVKAEYRAGDKSLWRGSYYILNGPSGYQVTFDKRDAAELRAHGRSL